MFDKACSKPAGSTRYKHVDKRNEFIVFPIVVNRATPARMVRRAVKREGDGEMDYECVFCVLTSNTLCFLGPIGLIRFIANIQRTRCW